MDKLGVALDMIIDKIKAEEGEDFKLGNGDEVVAVFNDGVIFLGKEDGEIQVKVVLGEPLVFDHDLAMTETVLSEEDYED